MDSLERIQIEHIPPSHAVHAVLFRRVRNAGFLQEQLLARNTAFQYAFVDASAVVSRRHALAAVFRAVDALLETQAQAEAQISAAQDDTQVPPVAGWGSGLRTPNVHSEIVCCLSASTNISEAYRRFGINPSTTGILVFKVLYPNQPPPPPQQSPASSINPATDIPAAASATAPPPTPTTQTPHQVWSHLLANVQGDPVPFTDEAIASCTDWAKVRKYYKLNGVAAAAAAAGETAKQPGKKGKTPSATAGGDVEEEARRRKEMEMLILGGMALRGL